MLVMETVLTYGAFLVKYFQIRFWKYQSFFIWTSYLGDPKYAYLIHFPLIYAFSRTCGIQILFATCISECLNLILKWILQEDRPYWWITENSGIMNNMTIQQFPITCETGPGSPSGHVMVATAILYIFVSFISEHKSFLKRFLAWILFIIFICAISTSRIFLAAHFPHQCLLGFVIGLVLGRIISRLRLTDLSAHNLIISGIALLLSTLLAFYLQEAVGINPNHSLHQAVKWCVKSSYIRLDTTPLFCAMRYTGTLLGSGVAAWGLNWNIHTFQNRKAAFLSAMLGLATCSLIIFCPLPHSSVIIYPFSIILHIVVFMVVVRMIPECVGCLFKHSEIKIN